MCPAKDRSSSKEDSPATFFMTNIVPQSPSSNRKGWERMEDYCRRLTRDGHVKQLAGALGTTMSQILAQVEREPDGG